MAEGAERAGLRASLEAVIQLVMYLCKMGL